MALAHIVPTLMAAVEASMARKEAQMFVGGVMAAATILDIWKRRRKK